MWKSVLWEPPWPRSSVLGLRPPGLEFRVLCLENSVISIISPSSGGSPGPSLAYMCTKVAKARLIPFSWGVYPGLDCASYLSAHTWSLWQTYLHVGLAGRLTSIQTCLHSGHRASGQPNFRQEIEFNGRVRQGPTGWITPNKEHTLTLWWFNVGLASQTVYQHWISRGLVFYWWTNIQSKAYFDPVWEKCWASVASGGPTLNQWWIGVLLGDIYPVLNIHPVLVQCWTSVANDGPSLNQ